VTAQQRMIDRTQERLGLWPERLAADAAYGSAKNLAWLVQERGIEPHIPVFDNQRSDGTFSRDDFTYDHKRDCYICPAGTELRQRQKICRVPRLFVDENGMMRYRASKLDCEGCALKPRCCPNAPARKILRSNGCPPVGACRGVPGCPECCRFILLFEGAYNPIAPHRATPHVQSAV
jgi:hypothetical protein